MLNCLLWLGLKLPVLPSHPTLTQVLQNATPLFLAAKNNHAEVVEMLLDGEADTAVQCTMLYVVTVLILTASFCAIHARALPHNLCPWQLHITLCHQPHWDIVPMQKVPPHLYLIPWTDKLKETIYKVWNISCTVIWTELESSFRCTHTHSASPQSWVLTACTVQACKV